MKRRQSNAFSLSFLDIMSCGLGAAALLFLIIKHQVDNTTDVSSDLAAETNLLAQEILIGQDNLAVIKNTISDLDNQLVTAQGLARQIQSELDRLLAELASQEDSSAEDISDIRKRIETLEQQKQTLEQQAQGGNNTREFVGQGNRQYLTGLKLGGRHVLILVDSSASMLDETIINIIRRRNQSDEIKMASAKWQQTLSIVDWIVANVDPGSHIQIYDFNETAQSTHPGYENRWISTDDKQNLEISITNLNNIVPAKGTSLYHAMRVGDSLTPKPDNIYLITDGLPTMAEEPAKNSTVSGNQRLSYFNMASREVRRNTPVNTILMPMEGDFLAAAAFWRLAINTNGAFIAPPRDWP